MKNFVKILLVTVFFSLLPVANLFALSKEATEVIEAMRARLKQSEKQEQTVVPAANNNKVESTDDYIPGKELSAALARYRRNIYSAKAKLHFADTIVAENSTSTTEKVQSVPVTPVEEKPIEKVEEKETYSNPPEPVDQEPEVEETIKTVSQETNNDDSSAKEDELIIIEAREADDSEAMNIPIDSNESVPESVPETTPVINQSNEYVPGQLLQQSVQRIRHSRKSNNPAGTELDEAIEEYERKLANKNSKNSEEVMALANEEIEELFNNPEKRARIAEEGRERYNQKSNNNDSDASEIDDEKFNDYISKYNFKMPENYRIIVE